METQILNAFLFESRNKLHFKATRILNAFLFKSRNKLHIIIYQGKSNNLNSNLVFRISRSKWSTKSLWKRSNPLGSISTSLDQFLAAWGQRTLLGKWHFDIWIRVLRFLFECFDEIVLKRKCQRPEDELWNVEISFGYIPWNFAHSNNIQGLSAVHFLGE